MIYAVSDLHGCYDKFMRLLEKIELKDEDTLYVLGDVVDRGPDNVKLISKLASRKNIRGLMGNHDYMAALMLKTFGMGDGKAADFLHEKPGTRDVFDAWLSDGGETTWKDFMRLSDQEKKIVLRTLSSLPVFTETEVNGRVYHLSHSVPCRKQMLGRERLLLSDYLFGRPEYDKVYFPDKILVTGHTPTDLIEEEFAGRIFRKNNHIAVDCGAVFGGPFGCICLDTGEEYYAE